MRITKDLPLFRCLEFRIRTRFTWKGDGAMKFYIKKLITLIITLLFVSFITFFAFQVIPGDSAVAKLGMDATEEQLFELRESMGLNDPMFVRYGRFLKNAITGDFGTSTQYNVSVGSLISERLPVTAWLAALSVLFMVVISLPLGLLCARKENGFLDRFLTFLSQTFMAVPPFFLGIIITLIFGIVLKWFIPGKFIPISQDFGGFLSYMVFPAFAVSIPKVAMLTKFLKTSLLRELSFDYVRTARSKGLKKKQIMTKHVLKNALIPVITFFGMLIADALAGSIVVEQVFNLPGMGRMLVTAIANRDFSVVSAAVLYIAGIVIIINFIVDMTYQKVDPRVRIS